MYACSGKNLNPPIKNEFINNEINIAERNPIENLYLSNVIIIGIIMKSKL